MLKVRLAAVNPRLVHAHPQLAGPWEGQAAASLLVLIQAVDVVTSVVSGRVGSFDQRMDHSHKQDEDSWGEDASACNARLRLKYQEHEDRHGCWKRGDAYIYRLSFLFSSKTIWKTEMAASCWACPVFLQEKGRGLQHAEGGRGEAPDMTAFSGFVLSFWLWLKLGWKRQLPLQGNACLQRTPHLPAPPGSASKHFSHGCSKNALFLSTGSERTHQSCLPPVFPNSHRDLNTCFQVSWQILRNLLIKYKGFKNVLLFSLLLLPIK